jgi:iron complex transport system substrate-binding protein
MKPAICIFCLLCLLAQAFSAFAGTLTWRDKTGTGVTVRVPVKRAVLYETYELLPVTGAWDRVAGISRFALENDLLRAVKPDFCRAVNSAGSAMDVNAETLFRLRPDVVITWSSNPKAVRFLRARGLPVIAVYPESIAELYSVIRLQGKLFGQERKVETAINEMKRIFAMIRFRTASIPQAARKGALWIGSKPTTAAGRAGVTSDLFRIINLENAAGSIRGRTADVPLERIAAWDPDLVFIWGNARYGAADILSNPQWRHVRAVRERAVFKAPHWSIWSPRIAPIALWMASRAYPERFRDVNIDRTIDDFYKKVYGIPYKKVTHIAN